MRVLLIVVILLLVIYVFIHIIDYVYDVNHLVNSYISLVGGEPCNMYSNKMKYYVGTSLMIGGLGLLVYGLLKTATSIKEEE